ncbi:MAG: hypothetical protein ACE5JP_18240 [Candidatus Bipolaricaulia bacterium]
MTTYGVVAATLSNVKRCGYSQVHFASVLLFSETEANSREAWPKETKTLCVNWPGAASVEA